MHLFDALMDKASIGVCGSTESNWLGRQFIVAKVRDTKEENRGLRPDYGLSASCLRI